MNQPVSQGPELLYIYKMLPEGCDRVHRMKPTLKEKSGSESPPPPPTQPGTLPGSTLLCSGNIATPPWETQAPGSPNRQAHDVFLTPGRQKTPPHKAL